MSLTLSAPRNLKGTLTVPGDKSVSHRALIFGAIAKGVTEITGLLESADVRSTEACLAQLGVRIERKNSRVLVHGGGLHGLKRPNFTLDCGNSGTTIRTLTGLLAGQSFAALLTGDESLRKRPMNRVAEPLRKMGAKIELTNADFAPVSITGAPLVGLEHSLPVASAQVKTALLMAGLYAEGTTRLTGKIGSRDHTERMLPFFDVQLERTATSISLRGHQSLRSQPIVVPGDASSAAYWITAACLVPGSKIEIQNLSLNPTRIGLINVLKRMGAKIDLLPICEEPEPVGNAIVSFSQLSGITLAETEVPSMIDELPLLAILATQAEGETLVRGASELRLKESDRIEAIALNLRAMGAEIDTFPDGFCIRGPQILRGARINSFSDHRIAMSFAIAALVAQGATTLDNPECVAVSYPDFFAVLRELVHEK